MNTIHLKVQAGLANRLRAWASAEWATDIHDIDYVMTWDIEDGVMAARWDELFTNTIPAPAADIESRPTLRLTHPTFIDLDDPEVQAADVVELDTYNAFSTTPDIKALHHRFWAVVRPYLLRLEPHPDVTSLVDEVVARFGANTMGVQIRAGGGQMYFNAPNRPTLEMFFDEIDTQRAEIPDLHLYLATDTPDLVGQFRDRYGDALITMDDHVGAGFRNFDSGRNIQVALAEILILSRTQKLLGTYFSSFGLLAGVLGAIPYYELGKPNTKYTWRKFEEGP